ncbi:MAG: hypothetical protein OEZ36_02590 [Spirochaetota bacterium]|nr:hypothetical protein [Spirochaetota bacterium]
MRRSLTLLTLALTIVLVQGLTNSYSHEEKAVVAKVQEKVPDAGWCYIQRYFFPSEMRIIINGNTSEDVILAGLDLPNVDFTEEYYWEVYNLFIFQKARLRYETVDKAKDGRRRINLFMVCCGGKKTSINKFLLKFIRVRTNLKPDPPAPKWHGHPNKRKRANLAMFSNGWAERRNDPSKNMVWLHKDGASWLPAAFKEEKKKAAAPAKAAPAAKAAAPKVEKKAAPAPKKTK